MCALALLPQGGAAAGVTPRQEQRAGGALPEAGGEQRGPADLVGDELVDLALVEQHVGRAGRGPALVEGGVPAGAAVAVLPGFRREQVGVRKPQHDAVVRVQHLGVEAEALGQPGTERKCPGGVHLRAERGVHHHAPVAQLVAEALDQDGAVVRHVAGGLALLGQVGQHIVHGPGVQPRAGQPFPGGGLGESADLAQERAQRAPQLQRAAELVALPERQPAGNAGGRGDQDAVPGDVLDAPGGRAQREHVAHARLVDHLLVQLADPPAPLPRVRAGQEHPEQAAVGDRAARGDGQTLRAGAAGEGAGHPVPDQPGAQLGERVGGIAAGQHVEHGVVGGLRQ